MICARHKWLLLLHQVPPSPPYLRARILRKLKQIGALALKNSAYLLPEGDEASEDLQWLVREIRSEQGEAWVFRTETVAGLTDDQIKESFRGMRSADYRELLAEAEAALVDESNRGSSLRKIRKRYEEITKIDFFDAPGKKELLTLMNEIDHSLQKGARAVANAATQQAGHSWVTRRGIKIDRTACCWLITRFIDPDAKFKFVDPDQYVHQDNELRFDMFEGEFTHEGDRCSFEVLMERYGIADAGVRAVAEIVHDLDLKDAKYGRPESQGVAAMIAGIGLRHADDADRLREGLVIFDTLHARLRAEP